MRYLYVQGQAAGQRNMPLTYEPEIFGPSRLVLFTNGDLKKMDSQELARALSKEGR